jgi:hypothetical protein
MMERPQRFHFSKVVFPDELKELLADPGFRKVWWHLLEEGFRADLAASGAVPVTEWIWEVTHHTWLEPAEMKRNGKPVPRQAWVIDGECMALRTRPPGRVGGAT